MGNALVAPSLIRPATSSSEPSEVNGDAFLSPAVSALCALTDFQLYDPVTVEIDCGIEGALAEMDEWGVHTLLVTQQQIGGIDLQVVGLITRHDIESRYARRAGVASNEHGGVIRVAEAMTAWDELALVKYDSLKALAARNLLSMFQATGLTHFLVVEYCDDDSAVARGLLSRETLVGRLSGDFVAPPS
jgi:CBS domain-containing protein